MRLKKLELLGYKTFASQTEFVFDRGITAVIGPNGSGKSNVADAIRWVLGEQSFSLLRAKKSDDMIFSGSEQRARMGMAEATMTLDNEQRWLPIEFGEVTITRRSYRDGQNEYLLNGSKVRLRDIIDLLGKSGLSKRTYTVIGQGLIDTALSLRPQERRDLIEEAAGITLYRSRRADALSKLDATKQNLLRVHDLVSEIGPQLKRLERQAERAQEYTQISEELDKALRIWYSYQWRRGRRELERVRTISRHQQERLCEQQALVQEWSTHIAQLRAMHSDWRQKLNQWHRQRNALHARSEACQRNLAVAGERQRMLEQQREQVQAEIEALVEDKVALGKQIAAQSSELAELDEVLAGQRARVQAAQAALDERHKKVDALAAARSLAQNILLTLRTQIAEHKSRLSQLDERQQDLEQEQTGHREKCRSLEERLVTLQERCLAMDAGLGELDETIQNLTDQRVKKESLVSQAQQQQQALHAQINELDKKLGRLRERHDLLTRMHQEGAGLYDGVRNVLQAARGSGAADPLSGVVGTVSELVQVPQELEMAIEVALGSQLQDVVVESWRDAQSAIAFLKRTRGGRATFLPLDTLHSGKPIRTLQAQGVIGRANDLVSCAHELRPVVDHLLGRTLVCRDLTAARHVLDMLKGGYQIVTLEGEIVRSSGAVTGGTRKGRRQGGILARERQRRELPKQIRALDAERRQLDESVQQAAREESAWQNEIADLVQRLARVGADRHDRAAERDRVQREVEQVAHERTWHEARVGEVSQERTELDERCQQLQQNLQELDVQTASTEEELNGLDAQLARLDDGDLQQQLAEHSSCAASTLQQQAAKRAELGGYRQTMRRLERQIESRHARLDELSAQLIRTGAQWEEARGQEETLGAELGELLAHIEPAEQKLEELERQQAQVEQDEQQARVRLQAIESRYNHTELQVTRQTDQMDSLKRQIENDLGMVELEAGEELTGQPQLPLEMLAPALPEVSVLPDGIEDQIRALRRRLRRLGAVNPNAPVEYEEVSQRHQFLSTQAQDLEQATAHLRQVVAELDQVMEREFKRTFQEIAREFKQYFARLFNGGSARLELTDPGDVLNTGIDIVARPPGKRQQGLALLSGGERALTAAALIFGILTVSPTPFCVLDEVDAALDEANVGRFRSVLQALSKQTQFVVITHNRYTIEIADVVYGVSMKPDGTSCVLSQRMDDEGR